MKASKSNRFSEVHDEFIRFEEETGLWDLCAGGKRYWHQVRYHVFGELVMALGLMGPRQGSWLDKPLSSWLKPRPGHWRQALSRCRWGDLEQADLLVFNHARHMWNGREWVCSYTHPLLEGLSGSRWTIEDRYLGQHYHPMRGDRLKYLDLKLAIAYARAALRLGIGGVLLSRTERRGIQDWTSELGRRFGGSPTPEKMQSPVRIAVSQIAGLGEIYEWLLDRVRPCAVLQVVHYSYRTLTVTPLAKQRGIPVVELQHGLIGPVHLAYNFASGRQPESFPDYLLTFGQWWRDITPGLPLPPERTPAVGFAWLDQHRRTAVDREAGKPRVVLFISQLSIGESLSRLAADAANLLKGSDFKLLYRLHSAEINIWQKQYPWLLSAPIEVLDKPTVIYDDLVRADAQVGVYSTAVFEGVAFGLPTFIATLPGYESSQPLVDCGAAVAFDQADELVHKLREATPPPPEIQHSIWKPNAKQNFNVFIENLLACRS